MQTEPGRSTTGASEETKRRKHPCASHSPEPAGTNSEAQEGSAIFSYSLCFEYIDSSNLSHGCPSLGIFCCPFPAKLAWSFRSSPFNTSRRKKRLSVSGQACFVFSEFLIQHVAPKKRKHICEKICEILTNKPQAAPLRSASRRRGEGLGRNFAVQRRIAAQLQAPEEYGVISSRVVRK